MIEQLCQKIDNCYKIYVLHDKDILNFQFAESVKSVCALCPDRHAGDSVEVREVNRDSIRYQNPK